MVVAKIVKNIYPNISHRFSGIFRQIIINKTLITLSKFSYFFESRYSIIFLLQNFSDNRVGCNHCISRMHY